MNKKLTIIVCTYNRSEILQFCLDSLVHQSVSKNEYNVLIVDNNSTDNTKKVSQQYIDDYDNFSLVFEKKQGLSNARNRGLIESETEWIGYLDDDGKARTNFVQRALWIIDNYKFDCFGGTYYAWWKFGKPKWLREDFGTKEPLLQKIGELKNYNSADVKYLSGGIMFLKRSIVEEIGGYNCLLGMNDKQLAFGEEIEFQNRLRLNGYKIGYDPLLAMDHLVNEYKLKVKWHLDCCFAKARDEYVMKNIGTENWNFLIIRLLKNIILFPVSIVAGFLKSIIRQNYYPKTAVYDSLKNIYTYLGKINAKITGK